MTLTRLLQKCQELASTEPPHRAAFLRQLCKQLHWFAGVQIRNVATLAGNIVTCSPISDLNPIWVAMGATFALQSTSGSRQVEAKSFFKGYRYQLQYPCTRSTRQEGLRGGGAQARGHQGG